MIDVRNRKGRKEKGERLEKERVKLDVRNTKGKGERRKMRDM
jgi:hypothetical protein